MTGESCQRSPARLQVLDKELAASDKLCDIEVMRIPLVLILTLFLVAGLAIPLAAQGKSEAASIRALELQWTESYTAPAIFPLSSLSGANLGMHFF